MLTLQELTAAGYKSISDPTNADSHGPAYRATYEKAFDDEGGTRYFLTVVHAVSPARHAAPAMDMFFPSARFVRNGTEFAVEMWHRDQGVDAVEAFFDDVWTSLRADHRVDAAVALASPTGGR